MKKGMRIIISGGGTGGHIFPAISVANALREAAPDCEILFVGAAGRMEMERVPAAGYKIEGLPVAGLKRSLSLDNLKLPFKILRSLRMAGKIIDKFNQKKINQLFVVDMLREGMNLVEANAIIVQLDSKNRSAVQMLGRALRHDKPVIHIFYYKDTQDEIYLMNSLKEFSEFVV